MRFYDMSSRKNVTVPDKEVKYETKTTKRGAKINFATAKNKKGGKMYRIVGRAK